VGSAVHVADVGDRGRGRDGLDVPAVLAARVRVLGSGRSSKTDPNDALSVAITALRHQSLRDVQSVGHGEVLRLLAKRNTDIGGQRCQVVSRMHSLLIELAPGGSAKEINASDVDAFLATGHAAHSGGKDPLKPLTSDPVHTPGKCHIRRSLG
jgi:hypothetical protein